MNIERLTRGLAGFLCLLSFALAYFTNGKYHASWILINAIVSLDLLQSMFTDRTLVRGIVRLLGARNPRR
jgi:hypothetical protein